MKTRKLGHTELELTTVGLGTWAMGGPWLFGWGPQDDGEAIAGILKALELGINWIDTAAIYGHGHSEELVGQALTQTREKPFVATKCGLTWNEQKERITCLKAESVRNECHASLKRLGIDRIDLYQIHRPDPDEDIEQAWEEMAKLQEQGKVRYIGVSNFNVEQIKRVQKIAPVASLQPPYNMLRRQVEDELLDYCAENNIGVIVYSPMQRGLLTGKFSYERLKKLAPDDHRLRCVEFQDPQFPIIMEFVEQLKPLAERNSCTLAQLAISWVLRRPEVTAAIVGARRPEQIAETYSASDWELSQDDIEEIEELLHALQEKINASQ
ncbi:MAG: aldo/keto reductase [Planctomycetota bacterium]|jgi:aryl-alcohol dehydrogenase-like predicted oxidoreductase